MRFPGVFAILTLLSLSSTNGQTTYVDVAGQVGLVLNHNDSVTCAGRVLPLESGSAWGDYDNDGDPDLFLTNGNGPNRLYRNEGDVNADGLPDFAEIGVALGLDDPTHVGHGTVFVDYDNDGDQDLYVLKWGGNSLYQNQLIETGSAIFVDVTPASGIGDEGRAITSAWGDFDQDGLLDVYLAKHMYCDDDPRNDDRLFHNNGDGTFTDVSGWLCPGGSVPCAEIQGSGFSASWLDYDNDGDPDLYVANEYPQTLSYPNILRRNDGPDGLGGWIFTDVSLASGTGISIKSMGLGIGDFDNNGYLDIAVSNVGDNYLLQNLGDGSYANISEAAGIQRTWIVPGQTMSITWGTAFFDHDNDRLLDLLYAAGPIGSNGALQPNAFFHNNGDLTFTDISAESGLGVSCRARTVSTVDLDEDGFIDVFVGQIDHPPLLLHNKSASLGNTNHWLSITAEGTVSNRDAIGTRITLITGDSVIQIRELASGSSYGSGDYRLALFGLGSYASGDLTIRWPNGVTEEIGTVAADQQLHFVEPGPGIPCDEVDFFNAKCNSNGAAQAMVRLLNSTGHAGKTVEFEIDGSVYPVVLVTNGTHTIGKLQVPQAGFGQHTVSLVDPVGCADPITVVCQVDGTGPDEFDRLWAEASVWSEGHFETTLHGNYPNPFNPSTTIQYSVGEDSRVTLKVYNTLGQSVTTLVDDIRPRGQHTVVWNGTTDSGAQVAAGIYFTVLRTGEQVRTAKMAIVK